MIIFVVLLYLAVWIWGMYKALTQGDDVVTRLVRRITKYAQR